MVMQCLRPQNIINEMKKIKKGEIYLSIKITKSIIMILFHQPASTNSTSYTALKRYNAPVLISTAL